MLNGRKIFVTISRDKGEGRPAELYYTFLPGGDLIIESMLLSKHNTPNAKWRRSANGLCWRFPPRDDFCYRFLRVQGGWEMHDEVGDDPYRHIVFHDVPPRPRSDQ